MTKDWVQGVGHSPVCQTLLQIVVRAVIASSPPAWTSSTEMSTQADFPFFNDYTAASTSLRRMSGHPLCLSRDSPVLMDLHQCQNYRTVSLISYPSKVMLNIIQNRLKQRAEPIKAEEQAGFRAGRSTTEQIFDLRTLCEKYFQHQQDTLLCCLLYTSPSPRDSA